MLPPKEFDVKNLLQWGTIIVGIGMAFNSVQERVENLRNENKVIVNELRLLQQVVYTLKEQVSINTYEIERAKRR